MKTFLTVTTKDLRNLSPEEAVDLFRKILWAEANSIGIGKNLINVSSAINVSDGGIDAEINSVVTNLGQGIIKQGKNRYQIKTGKFSLTSESEIKSILFKEKTEELKPRIKSCLDDNGFLGIVLFGYDNPDTVDDGVLTKFKEKLKHIDQKYENARIEIWRQNQIISFLQNFPSLRREIIKTEQFPFFSHKDWYNYFRDMQTKFIVGKKQVGFINQIREELRKDNGPVDVRIVGNPGSGKTRIVYEITNTEDLSTHVVYFESPKSLNDSNFVQRLLRDEHAHTILVVDECDIHEKRDLWNKISTVSPRIKLVTIYNEADDDNHSFDIPNLEEEEISSIIAGYGVSKEDSSRFAPACVPSPRLANWMGQNLISNPTDFSAFSGDVTSIYERFIANRLDLGSQTFRDRKTVLIWLSLFTKVGFEYPYDKEAKIIAKKIEQSNSSISWQKFLEIVNELRKLKVLQGYKTLYITPFLLHLWLWQEWWKLFGKTGFDLDEFILVDNTTKPFTYLPHNMLGWFFDMFVYASESSEALKIVQQLLGQDGPLNDGQLLETDIGARLFSALAKADNKSALDLLNRTVGQWSKEKRLEFRTGRREALWILETIVRDPDNFKDASKLLLLLAESENEGAGNNATGVFTHLFSMAPGKLAATYALIQTRLAFLEEILDSKDKEKRIIGLQACNVALESLHFTRLDYSQGKLLILKSDNWIPGTKEIESYKKVLEMICVRLDRMEFDDQQKAVDIIISRARALTRLESLANYIVEKFRTLSKKQYVDLEKIISETEGIIHYDSKTLDPEIVKLWQDFKKETHRDDFPFLMQRYVRMDIHTDDFDENGVMSNKSQEKIKKLATMVIENKKLLQPEFNWLITTSAKNGYWFGFELGKLDAGFTFLSDLLDAQLKNVPNPTGFFLGGYFMAIFQNDVGKWEETLDLMVNHPKLCHWIPEITWRSGMTDRAGLRIVNLVNKDVMKKSDFAMFIYGAVGRRLSDEVFLKWIKILLNNPTIDDLMIAIPLFYEYYADKGSSHPLPEEISLQLISSDLLFGDITHARNRVMDAFYWTGIAKKFVQQFPDKISVLADKMLQNMEKDNNIIAGYHSETLEVLDLMSGLNPELLWESIKKYIGPPLDHRAFRILSWINGDENDDQKGNILTRIPFEKISEWIEVNKNENAAYLARFIPKKLFHGGICIAREFLIKYSDIKDVRDEIHANFSGMDFWTGSGVDHYTKKKEWFIEFKKNEENENVRTWLDEHITSLEHNIEQMKSMEEREF